MSKGWQGEIERCYWVPDSDIDGKIPNDLEGTLIRNGPGISEVYGKKLKHPIDGDGMICKLTIVAGKVQFQSRFVSSTHRKAEEKARQFMYTGQMGTRDSHMVSDTLSMLKTLAFGSKPSLKMRNPSNTNVFYWGGKILSLYETHLPYCIDPYSLETLGLEDLKGALSLKNSAAHYRIDPETMNLIMLSLRASFRAPATVEINEFDGKWNVVHKSLHCIPGLNYIHDFVLLPHYYLFHMTPFVDVSVHIAMKIFAGFTSPGESMRLYPDKPSQFVVVPRYGKTKDVMYFKTDPCHIFHFGTAEQIGDEISFNCVCLGESFNMSFAQQLWLSNTDVCPGHVFQVTLNLRTESCSRKKIDTCSAEFPSTHPFRNGQTGTRILYLMASDRKETIPYRDIVKLDCKSLKRSVWNSDGIIGEPVFVPRHGYASNKDGDEDDGYVLVQLYHPETHRTDFCILDAKHMKNGPVARIKLKHHVPYGFHGTFWPEIFLHSPVNRDSEFSYTGC